MFGSALAIFYRNFWLNIKANILSLVFIAFGIVVLLPTGLLSIFYVLIIIPVQIWQQSLCTHSMVDDRFSNFKIIYNIMGLKKSLYVVGQSLSYILQSFFLNAVLFGCVIFYDYTKTGENNQTLYDFYLFGLTLLFLITFTFYSIALSFVFKTPSVAKDISVAFNFLFFYFSIYTVLRENLWAVQLVSPFSFLVRFIYEVWNSPFNNNLPEIGPFVYYMLAQALVYLLAAIYLENVFGGEGEHNKHPLFFLGFTKKKEQPRFESSLSQNLVENFDAESNDDKALSIKNLSKKFGNFKALKNINVSFSTGKMHCLLGHNGAGKTTFINVLTGFCSATTGSMTYKGEDLRALESSESTRIQIGICPPNDILSPDMTVYQHLKMMTLIKELADAEDKIDLIMQQVNITEYFDYKIKELSGGNKRKLTIALALIGAPNLLFLDEPTSSLDPASRKDIWRILSDVKAKRPDLITILTTHHLEEAETLADNIVVLAAGTVKVKGAISEIKKAFGIGYTFELVSKEKTSVEDFKNLIGRVNSHFNEPLIENKDLDFSERKVEIKISLSNSKNLLPLIDALKKEMPSDIFFTVNSNTLEKAYIQIDQEIYNDFSLKDKTHVFGILKNIYLKEKTSTLQIFWALFINKAQLLIANFIEIFKLISQYMILGGTLGLIVYYAHYKEQRPIDLSAAQAFFFSMVFLEVLMSGFSLYNFVYEKCRDLKFLLFVNKVKPWVYFAAKLFSDFCLITIGYAILFGFFYYILLDDFNDERTLLVRSDFFLLCFKTYVWRITFACVGLFYYRMFDSTKSVLVMFPAIYLAIYVGLTIVKWKTWDELHYINDFAVVIAILPENDIGYIETFLSFIGIILVHLLLVLVIENRSLRFNFLNSRINFGLSEETIQAEGRTSSFDPVHKKLLETVIREGKETLSTDPKNLKVIKLKKQYPRGKVALDKVTFNIDSGTQFGLVGPNGAGKSTLFNILLGKIEKTSGNVLMKSVPAYSAFPLYLFQQDPYASNSYGVSFQGDALWDQLKVSENIRFFCRLHNINETALEKLLEYFEFDNYLDKYASELSSGNKRKLCIILSLLANPNVILFDEATCGVDLYMRLKLKAVFEYYLKENNSMAIFTTHFLKDIEIFCDKLGIIDKGKFLCIEYIDVLKKNLGGYVLHMHVADLVLLDKITKGIGKNATVKVTSVDNETGFVKCLLNDVKNVLEVFAYLLRIQQEGLLKEVSINQLSIEDIYLDLFNRSE